MKNKLIGLCLVVSAVFLLMAITNGGNDAESSYPNPYGDCIGQFSGLTSLDSYYLYVDAGPPAADLFEQAMILQKFVGNTLNANLHVFTPPAVLTGKMDYLLVPEAQYSYLNAVKSETWRDYPVSNRMMSVNRSNWV